MKLDLSNLLKGKVQQEGWTVEGFKTYLQNALIGIIRLELENLPEAEWERVLGTWVKICFFCKSIMNRGEEERHRLYQKFGFDGTMIHISESVIEKLHIAQSLGMLKQKDGPDRIIRLALEGFKDASREVAFMKSFFGIEG